MSEEQLVALRKAAQQAWLESKRLVLTDDYEQMFMRFVSSIAEIISDPEFTSYVNRIELYL